MLCPECNGKGETIYYVETDRDENTVTVEQRKGICRTCNGSGKKPQTNADRIRAMSDEELARHLHCIGWDCHLCAEHRRLDNEPLLRNEKCDENCFEHCLEWLKQPADMRGEEDAVQKPFGKLREPITTEQLKQILRDLERMFKDGK